MQHLYNVLRILEKLRIREWDTQAHGHTGSMEVGEGTVLRTLEQYQQHAHRCLYNRVWTPKDVKPSELDTRWTKYSNPAIHTLLNPCAPKSLLVGVLAKVMLSV